MKLSAVPPKPVDNIWDGARRLADFLASDDGQAALALLGETERSVTIASYPDDGGIYVRFILDATGFREIHEDGGSMGLAYAVLSGHERPFRATSKPLSPTEVVASYTHITGKSPSTIVDHLIESIDRIAAGVLGA